MRDRERRFEDLMKRPQGVLANNVIELENRIRELEDEMRRVAWSLTNVVERARQAGATVKT